MKWPWVSREQYDDYVRAHRMLGDELTRQRNALDAERARYDALLDKYHALKFVGATIPEPVRPLERKDPDPLMQAINVLSAGKPGLRTTMMQQLATDRANPLLDDADILQRIQSGVSVYDDEGVPG